MIQPVVLLAHCLQSERASVHFAHSWLLIHTTLMRPPVVSAAYHYFILFISWFLVLLLGRPTSLFGCIRESLAPSGRTRGSRSRCRGDHIGLRFLVFPHLRFGSLGSFTFKCIDDLLALDDCCCCCWSNLWAGLRPAAHFFSPFLVEAARVVDLCMF